MMVIFLNIHGLCADGNKIMNPRQIFVFAPIDDYSAQFIIQQLLMLDRDSNDEITMFINSGGGYVSSMFSIIDTMNIVKSPIRTVVMGIAASAAAAIAACGDTRLITQNSQYMLHEVSSLTYGSMSSMEEDMAQSLAQQNKMINILSAKTKQSPDTIKNTITKTDKFFSATDAVNFGLADKVIQDQEAQVLKLSEPINVEGYEISQVDREVQLLREGKFHHPIYGEVLISSVHLDLMKSNFDNNVRGIDISIDYTHDNEGGESPAACWIKELHVKSNKDGKGKGLFARVEFTPKGQQLVSAKEYKYSSADFAIDYIDQDGKHHPYVLRGGTLTNRPFIKGMNPIKLSEYKPTKENKTMNKEQLIAALKAEGIDIVSLQTQATSLTQENVALKRQITDLSALPAQKDTEIKALKDQLAVSAKKIVDDAKGLSFNKLVEEGKAVPAQKDSILKTFETAEAMESFYKDSPVVVKFKEQGSGSEGDDQTLSADEEAVVATGRLTREQVIAGRSFIKKDKNKKTKKD